jgi:DNA-binding transcriptional regulator GbsR (MarR family)
MVSDMTASAARDFAAEDPPTSVHQYDEFIDGFAALMETRSVPRAAGRIFSYLQVSEPAEQTAAQISQALGVSLGTVSGMTRLLMNAGWVRRITRRGERQAVYRAAEGTMTLAVDGVMEPIRQARTLTSRGLELMAGRSDEARARLQELNDVYRFFEEWFPLILEQWHRREESKGE